MRFLAPLLVMATSAIAVSQDPKPPQTPHTPRTGEAQASVSNPDSSKADGILAGWLLIDNENEVALAQLAQQRAQDPKVKQFAQKMLDDHRQMSQKLQPIASTAGFSGSSARGSMADRDTGQRDTGERDPAQGGDKPERGDNSPDSPTARAGESRPRAAGASRENGELDHVALIQELGQQCLASARKELEQKSGAEFDRCYMSMMVGAHMKANDMLTVFQRHASGELATVMADGQKKVAAHLQHAKDICKDLEGGKQAKPASAGQ